MKPTITLLTLTAAAFVLTASMTAPAQAASRTWVSGSGDDTNPCTRASPCATFDAAYKVTDAFGEINCTDAGTYGHLQIFKSITISCEGGTAGVLATVSDGFDVSAGPTDVVYLRGLDINGKNSFGTTGIYFNEGGTLHVERCLIHGYADGWGIFFYPFSNGSLFVADTVIADNGLAGGFSGGMALQFQSAANATVSLERVQVTNNNIGFDADGSSGNLLAVSIRDSLASGNTSSGFVAETTGGTTRMMIQNSEASNNGSNGIKADGTNALLFVGGSAIFGNASAITIKNGATLLSYQNNQIDGNSANDTPVPAQTLH
jgi:hypothetical protein